MARHVLEWRYHVEVTADREFDTMTCEFSSKNLANEVAKELLFNPDTISVCVRPSGDRKVVDKNRSYVIM